DASAGRVSRLPHLSRWGRQTRAIPGSTWKERSAAAGSPLLLLRLLCLLLLLEQLEVPEQLEALDDGELLHQLRVLVRERNRRGPAVRLLPRLRRLRVLLRRSGSEHDRDEPHPAHHANPFLSLTRKLPRLLRKLPSAAALLAALLTPLLLALLSLLAAFLTFLPALLAPLPDTLAHLFPFLRRHPFPA